MVYQRLSLISSLLVLAIFIIAGCSSYKEDNSQRTPAPPESVSFNNNSQPNVAAAPVGNVSASMSPEMRQSMEDRILIIEERLTKLREEMNLIRPAIKELIARQNLPQQMKEPVSLTPTVPLSEPTAQLVSVGQPKKEVVVPPAPKAVSKPKVQSLPKTYKGPSKLSSIRTGEHTGKTRLVLDVGSKTPYSYDLDNAEKVMVIELPDARHDSVLSGTLSKSPFISSYKSEASGESGSRVIIALKKSVKVLNASTIGATSSQGYRIYFDIGN